MSKTKKNDIRIVTGDAEIEKAQRNADAAEKRLDAIADEISNLEADLESAETWPERFTLTGGIDLARQHQDQLVQAADRYQKTAANIYEGYDIAVQAAEALRDIIPGTELELVAAAGRTPGDVGCPSVVAVQRLFGNGAQATQLPTLTIEIRLPAVYREPTEEQVFRALWNGDVVAMSGTNGVLAPRHPVGSPDDSMGLQRRS